MNTTEAAAILHVFKGKGMVDATLATEGHSDEIPRRKKKPRSWRDENVPGDQPTAQNVEAAQEYDGDAMDAIGQGNGTYMAASLSLEDAAAIMKGLHYPDDLHSHPSPNPQAPRVWHSHPGGHRDLEHPAAPPDALNRHLSSHPTRGRRIDPMGTQLDDEIEASGLPISYDQQAGVATSAGLKIADGDLEKWVASGGIEKAAALTASRLLEEIAPVLARQNEVLERVKTVRRAKQRASDREWSAHIE